jgi:tetrahydromethanopterin S-methyltransferase subunit G
MMAEREPVPDAVPQPDPPQRIHGRLEVDEDEVHVVEGIIEQEFGVAKLTGLLYLRDLRVDLTGELTVVSPDSGAQQTLPILQVGGTLDAMSASIGNSEEPAVREGEANMVEAFRKAEREMRLKEREKRKQRGPSGG